MASSNSCLYARTKWWLMPSPKACRPRLSSGTARSWLVMLPSPLDSYVASPVNFERWLWVLRFSYFSLVCLYFFSPSTWRPVVLSCVWLIFFRFFVYNFLFSGFHNSLFFWFAQYCFSKIPLLCMGESDKAPTNKIYHRAAIEQRPRTRSCHESEHLI